MNQRGRALRALAACLRAGPDLAADAFPAIADYDWMATLALANEHLLSPTLHRAVVPSHRVVPSEVRRYLNLLHTANYRRNRAIRRQALQLVRALNAAGIEPMLLKGILMTLAERSFGRGARMMADIDIAVPAGACAAAVTVLVELGYAINREFPLGHHAVAEYTRPGDPAAVDLHIELIDQKYLLPAAEVWAAAARWHAAGGGTYWVPSPTHRAMHNILHAQVHYRGGYYRGQLDLRQLFELAYLAKAYERQIDWVAIAKRLRAHHLEPMLHSYVGSAHDLLAMAWPFGARLPLRRARLHAWRCRWQLCHPALAQATLPWANLRAAFAWHRMAALYRSAGGMALTWRIRHARSVLARHRPAFFLDRLFRL